ncbi:MAG: TraR/DksA family transcriptional regulator [Calditrichaeota bacterium]|nr:MAG: TraR/DksA family transcriptional regulator [Calditrichota bacterium]
MDNKKKEYYIKKILEERNRVLGGLDMLTQNLEGAAEAKVAEFEEAARNEREREYLSSLISQDIEEMTEINEALKRILDGTYGICVDCGKEIPQARLEAKPTALRCVECQHKLEMQKKI